MFSLLINAAKYVLGPGKNDEPDLDEVIAELEGSEDENANEVAPVLELDDVEESANSFTASGTVTFSAKDTIVIDNTYSFDLLNSTFRDLKVGTKINYIVYQKTKNAPLKVRKIVSIVNTAWDDQDETPSSPQPTENMQTINKRMVAKVISRSGRSVSLEPGNLTISLDKVSSTFIPYVGDWVNLDSTVELDEHSTDLSGEILEVEKIEPLRSRLKIGQITKYDSSMGVGYVEKDTVFNKISCQPGYLPCVGDKVACDAIESDQGIATWRCLSVVPLEQSMNTTFDNEMDEDKALVNGDALPVVENKRGISITNDLVVNLDVNEVKEVTVYVTNNTNNITYTLCKGMFMSQQSQLTLKSPQINTVTILRPGNRVVYVFRCTAAFVGSTEEKFVFCFQKFKISRTFRINVRAKYLSVAPNQPGRNYKIQQVARQDEFDPESYIPGVRTCKPPSFITVRNAIFKIPQRFWDTVLPCINDRVTQVQTETIVGDTFPFLNDVLTPRNYKDRYHALLYLETISLRIDMQKYDMSSTSMFRNGEYLVLKVPGLVEKRPSLIVGDRAIVSFNWDKSGGALKYEGCIHEIKNSEVYLKFNPSFHATYNSEDCQITFKNSHASLTRCHSAINLAVQNLGVDILFPTSIQEKQSQIELKEADCQVENIENTEKKVLSNSKHNIRSRYAKLAALMNKLDEDKKEMKKPSTENVVDSCVSQLQPRKLIWFNKRLNFHQKEAVRNILCGNARPLPYVIFGPPGTGKTITLCEAIVQILTLIPESRLLVATPSNSSANLVAERLLDSGVLKPGDLVRLIAHHCLTDDSIPERLLPYCATGDLAAEHSSKSFYTSTEGTRVNCTARVLGRHRVTIGTCMALGLLHNMGFPRGHFTHILVDEAGQATEPEIMIPLTFTHSTYGQIILAGDPMQLGPVVNSKLSLHFGLGESFLVRLLNQFPYQRDPVGFKTGYNPKLVTKLLINYRSLPEILELPNSLFYDAELKPFLDAETSPESEMLRQLSSELPARKGQPPALVFHGVNGENCQDADSPSWYNPAEATQVYLYLLKLYAKGLTEHDIGIITPYKKQVHQIRELLMELDMQMPKVGSVEEFQGQERKVIIVSAVRSAEYVLDEDIKHALGFVASPRRLNVAITRARVLLIIIGNPNLLSRDSYWQSVLFYCLRNGSYTGCNFSLDQMKNCQEADNMH